MRRQLTMLFPKALIAFLLMTGGRSFAVTRAPIIGEIESLSLDSPGDHFAGGMMVVGGQNVIIPRNLLIDLPANRLTLAELFALAPDGCRGTTGLGLGDPCRVGLGGAIATILANRAATGEVIAGEVFIAKGVESVTGEISYLDYDQGFFRINGIVGDPLTGLMVRIDDPEGVHTIQSGLGCVAGSMNCSADVRFGVDPTNYTAAFATGYPLCIPSTSLGNGRTVGSDVLGVGDPFCPQRNRDSTPAADSTRFAPLRLGDGVLVEGNHEVVNGVRFLSAWHVQGEVMMTTRDDPSQPDYVTTDEVEWDVPAFANQRARFLLIGFSTLPNSQLDAFALHNDTRGEAHEVPLASTVNSPGNINQGILPLGTNIFKVHFDVDFLTGTEPRLSPCIDLLSAGFDVCPDVSLADELSIISPVARELIVHTRRTAPLSPGVTAFDVRGRETPHGRYLTPVGMGHPEFGEINLRSLQTPFFFSGIPWNLDRRLGPGGCDGPCEDTPQPLDPFPFEGQDPRSMATIPPGAENRMFSFFPFGPEDVLAWPPPEPAPRGIAQTTFVSGLCGGGISSPPVILSLDPSSAEAGASLEASIVGSGFSSPIHCDLGPLVDVACELVSSTELRAVIHLDRTASPGPRDLVVTGPDGSAAATSAFLVLAATRSPGPHVVAAAPDVIDQGTIVTVTLMGEGFAAGMTCDFGAGIAVTRCEPVSGWVAMADVVVDPAAPVGPHTVTVFDADGNACASARVVTVVESAPLPIAVDPNVVAAGQNTPVAILGAGFDPGAVCDFGADLGVVDCAFVDRTRLTATLDVPFTATLGPRDLQVTNPDGTTGFLPGGLQITAPLGPELVSATPSSANRGSSVVVQLVGAHFHVGAFCDFGAGVLVTGCEVLSNTSIAASIDIPLSAALGSRDVRVQNTDGQSAVLGGGFTVTEPGPVLLFSDDFSRPNGPLGPDWLLQGRWDILAGQARSAAALGTAVAGVATPSDVSGGALVALGPLANGSGVVVRAQGTSLYAARLLRTNRVQLIRVDAGTVTVLADAATPVGSAFHSLMLSVSGAGPVQLSLRLDGAPSLSATDSAAPLTSGRAGLLSGTTARSFFDDFRLTTP